MLRLALCVALLSLTGCTIFIKADSRTPEAVTAKGVASGEADAESESSARAPRFDLRPFSPLRTKIEEFLLLPITVPFGTVGAIYRAFQREEPPRKAGPPIPLNGIPLPDVAAENYTEG